MHNMMHDVHNYWRVFSAIVFIRINLCGRSLAAFTFKTHIENYIMD